MCAVAAAQNTPPANEWQAVEQALGRTGQVQGDGAYKAGMPRGDMNVTVAGTEVKPALGLGSWVAFSKPGTGAMMMGDLVLAEDEVTPVMTSLQANGIEITALHNHVLHESPRVMYMHISGLGAAVKLAAAVKDAISLTMGSGTDVARESADVVGRHERMVPIPLPRTVSSADSNRNSVRLSWNPRKSPSMSALRLLISIDAKQSLFPEGICSKA
jgi:hypothetical protein